MMEEQRARQMPGGETDAHGHLHVAKILLTLTWEEQDAGLSTVNFEP